MEKKRGLFPLLAILFKLFSKAKYVLVIIAKILTKYHVAEAIATFGISLGAYTWLFGLKFSLFLMILLLVHELGHLLGMKIFRMKIRGLYFIPLMGAALVPDEEFRSVKSMFVVALLGPVIGLVMCLLFTMLYVGAVHVPELGAAAVVMLIVNFLNLIPAFPLDGGRCAVAIILSFLRPGEKLLEKLRETVRKYVPDIPDELLHVGHDELKNIDWDFVAYRFAYRARNYVMDILLKRGMFYDEAKLISWDLKNRLENELRLIVKRFHRINKIIVATITLALTALFVCLGLYVFALATGLGVFELYEVVNKCGTSIEPIRKYRPIYAIAYVATILASLGMIHMVAHMLNIKELLSVLKH